MKVSPGSRWLPMPIHSLLLWIVWLLLNNSFSVGHMLLGAILALVIPLMVARLTSPHLVIRRPGKAVLYCLKLAYDILVANLEVALRVIGPLKKLNPAFIAIPLDIQDELPLTLLASTISLTPGTLSAEISEDRQWLYVHVLHLQDEQALIHSIKERYERDLREIFQC